MTMRVPVFVLPVVAVVAGSALVAAGADRGTRDNRGDRGDRAAAISAVMRYEDAIAGPARDGGFVVQQGMKPAVAALGRGTPAPVGRQAVGWADVLQEVKERFAAASPPPELAEAAAAFDRALHRYRIAVETIGAAALASGDGRLQLLDQAVAAAREADAEYDRASSLLQTRRRQLGLGPSTRFPRPEERA